MERVAAANDACVAMGLMDFDPSKLLQLRVRTAVSFAMMTAAVETGIVRWGRQSETEEPEWATADSRTMKSTVGGTPGDKFNREDTQK
jgi:hypothetical protein